jgi:hypothetical protein
MNQQSIQHHPATTTATLVPDKPAGPPAPVSARHVFKLGLDVDMHFAVTAIQCDHGAIKPAQKLTRPQLLKWVREQVAAGHTVHTVYEACGFGYTLHEELTAAGAQSLVTTPMCLSPERQRKNDRLDALQRMATSLVYLNKCSYLDLNSRLRSSPDDAVRPAQRCSA